MRVLVTGANGFAGRHLLAELGARAARADIDITEPESVAATVREASPAAVAHLAALSSVAESWRDASEVWRVNALGTVNLLEAVRAEAPGARVLVVSSSEVYGSAKTIPTSEREPRAPLSPYAASKAAAEIACDQARRGPGLDIVVARSFPHIGPGQDQRFAVGSWVSRIARLEAEGGGTLHVGDLSVERDLTDVRDACRAYRLLLEPATPAGYYNVCTGSAVALGDVLDLLLGMAQASITVQRDPTRVRCVDIAVMRGDNSRIREATGWAPAVSLETSLADALTVARTLVTDV